MCRRFSMSSELETVRGQFDINQVMYFYKKRYNISPTQTMPVIVCNEGQRVLDEYRWGLVPYWGKDAVNADLQTVYRNPSYRKIVESRRCIIPCSGFYYMRTVGKKSYAVRVIARDQEMLGVAGLYETWRNAKGEDIRTCTMVMTEANETIREFDDRMPAIMQQGDLDYWLRAESADIEDLLVRLRTYRGQMHTYPVTPLVGRDDHDHRMCIEEMDLKQAWIKDL